MKSYYVGYHRRDRHITHNNLRNLLGTRQETTESETPKAQNHTMKTNGHVRKVDASPPPPA